MNYLIFHHTDLMLLGKALLYFIVLLNETLTFSKRLPAGHVSCMYLCCTALLPERTALIGAERAWGVLWIEVLGSFLYTLSASHQLFPSFPFLFFLLFHLHLPPLATRTVLCVQWQSLMTIGRIAGSVYNSAKFIEMRSNWKAGDTEVWDIWHLANHSTSNVLHAPQEKKSLKTNE